MKGQKEESMRLEVRPIHGWGWTDGQVTIDVPSPFEIETDGFAGKEINGTVVSSNHDLAGYAFEACPRHAEADGQFNCSLKSPVSAPSEGNSVALVGYCIMDPGLGASR